VVWFNGVYGSERSVLVQILERPVQFQDKNEAGRGRGFHFLAPFITSSVQTKEEEGRGLPACLPAFYCMPLYMASKELVSKSIRIHSGKSSDEIRNE
jgi:hypothetical protein